MTAKKPISTQSQAPDEQESSSASNSKPSTTKASAVHLGHIFSLRPKVETSFEAQHLQSAKVFLQDERFSDLDSAARAVAKKALELTRKSGSKKARQDRKRS
ncbi:hypothetical protein MK292_02345 [Myxococcota bacterium]|jgi:hypothetical protein|nr:hypothetical protein [Myxococcota bacterium]|tara:strand:+ start:1372 stop:1677 length:306 start_codon:yes stop_codon:yes gene_type:complete